MSEELIHSYRYKAYEAMPQFTNGDDLIVQRIAVTFADEKSLDENLPKLAKELRRFTRNSEPQFWNKVYDEFKLRDRLDLIPKIAEDVMSDFASPGIKKAVLQGLSNLGNENSDNLDFNQLMQDFYKNEKKDEVVSLIDEYYKSPDDSKLEKLGSDLAKVITKHPIEEQIDLWSKARDNFEKQSFGGSLLEKQVAITQGAITEINSNEEQDALVNGLSGFSRFFSNKLGKMRINESSSSFFRIPPKNGS